MSWVLYDPPQSFDNEVDGVIIVANTPGGPLSGIFDHIEAANNLLNSYYASIGPAYEAATTLGEMVATALGEIEDLTQAGVGISPLSNPPSNYTKQEGINVDGDAFEEFMVVSKPHNGQTRYSVFADSDGDNLYDRRIDLGPII